MVNDIYLFSCVILKKLLRATVQNDVSHLIISKSLTTNTHVFTRAIVTLLEMLRTFSI